MLAARCTPRVPICPIPALRAAISGLVRCGRAPQTAAHPNRLVQLRELRAQTGAPLVACQTALTEAGGSTAAAVAALKAQGHLAVEKKQGRTSSEGVLAVASAGPGTAPNALALVEVNCESDFAARTGAVRTLAQQAATAAAAAAADTRHTHTGPMQWDTAQLLALRDSDGAPLQDMVAATTLRCGEKLVLRRAMAVARPGALGPRAWLPASYLHHNRRCAALVVLRAHDTSSARALAASLAVHVAGMAPAYTSRDTVPPDVWEALVAQEVARLPAKHTKGPSPLEIAHRRLDKNWIPDHVLHEQTLIAQGDADPVTVAHALSALDADGPAGTHIEQWHRYEMGEGLVRREDDFAAQVADQLRKGAAGTP